MTRLSAALIVRNEARFLPECLASLQGVVDEIVVVDTGSTDDTVALAEAAGARCEHFSWSHDFAAARNFALERATGDYVLTIDADERVLDPGAARTALLAFADQHDGNVAGTVTIRNVLPDAGESVDHTERFFRRDRFRYEGAIHEQILPVSGEKDSAATGVDLLHLGYAQAYDEPAHKAHRNIPILRRELERHPDDEYYWHQLGKAHYSLREYAEAARAFEAALAAIRFSPGEAPLGRLGPVSREVLTTLVSTLAYAYANLDRCEDARALLDRHAALRHPGVHRADFSYVRGYVALMLGDIGASRAAFTEALRLGPEREDVRGTGSYTAAYHLGLLAEADADLEEAARWYAESLRMRPDYPPALFRCIDFVTEYTTAPWNAIRGKADDSAFVRCFLDRLESLVKTGCAADASRLLKTAPQWSPALLAASRTRLESLLDTPE
jgi:tetratricopeptide (TPR) repeat protein